MSDLFNRPWRWSIVHAGRGWRHLEKGHVADALAVFDIRSSRGPLGSDLATHGW